MAPFKPSRVKAPAQRPTSLADIAGAVNALADEVGKLNGGVTLAQSTPGLIKNLSFLMPPAPPWKLLTSGASWDSSCDYLVEPGGMVRLRGTFAPKAGKIAPVAAGTGTSILATFDAGYWPEEAAVFPGKSGDGGTQVPALFSLTTAGALAYVGGTATADLVGVDGLHWYAMNAVPPHQFAGANWPLRVEHGFDSCCGLVVLGFRRQEAVGQNVGVGTPLVDWVDLGDGTLRINGVWGLQWGKRYDLRLYLSPERE